MRLFTPQEANRLLLSLRPKLEHLRKMYERLDTLSERARAAAAASQTGGGMEGGTEYVKLLYQIGRVMTDVNETGVQIKDHQRGLIDFPSLRDGRVVLLCWQLADGDRISWWHEMDAGFAGRQSL
jgi:hypothetical protein